MKVFVSLFLFLIYSSVIFAAPVYDGQWVFDNSANSTIVQGLGIKARVATLADDTLSRKTTLIGVLNGNKNYSFSFDSKTSASVIELKTIPLMYQGLSGFDAIVLKSVPNDLLDEQWRALHNWVVAGGVLIVFLREDLSVLFSKMFSEYKMPSKITKQTLVTALNLSSQNKAVLSKPVGFGAVILAAPSMTTKEALRPIIQKHLAKKTMRFIRRNNKPTFDTSAFFNSPDSPLVFIKEAQAITITLVVLLIFIAVVLPASVSAKKAVLFLVVFALIANVVVLVSKQKQSVLLSHYIIEEVTSGFTHGVENRITVLATRNGKHTEPIVLYNMPLAQPLFVPNKNASTVLALSKTHTTLSAPYPKSKEAFISVVPTVSSEISWGATSETKVRVKNNTTYFLRDVARVSFGKVFPLGDIKPMSSIEMECASPKPISEVFLSAPNNVRSALKFWLRKRLREKDVVVSWVEHNGIGRIIIVYNKN